MQPIAHVSARIREIQSRVESPSVPGQFRNVLNRTLSDSSRAGASPEAATDHPTNAMTTSMWEPVPPMTLGVMLGVPTPAASSTHDTATLPPVTGIMTRVDLEAYLANHEVEARNGRLHDGELVAVSGGWNGAAKLLPPAATAWEAMRTAAAADGIDLKAIDSYRTWESQARAYEAHLRGEKKANVLAPGHSEHGNGLAVDVTNGSIIGTDDAEWTWLQDNAARFGWHPISNETWHWEFRGVSA